jgi:hypothetical protein
MLYQQVQASSYVINKFKLYILEVLCLQVQASSYVINKFKLYVFKVLC